MKEPEVSVIVLSHNDKERLRKCLLSVQASDYTKFEVLVVDNASSDGTIEMVAKEFPNVRLIKNHANLGYARGNNTGIRNARGEYLALINCDTVATKSWLRELINEAEQRNVAIVQPKILLLNGPDIIDSAGNMINILGFGFPRGIGEKNNAVDNRVVEISHPCGVCFLIHRKCLEDVGMFDESYFAYSEDVDLGWRARMLGWRAYYVPRAIIYHDHDVEKLSPLKFMLHERNRWITILKNYSTLTIVKILPAILIVELLVFAHAVGSRLTHLKIRSYADLVKLLSHIKAERARLQTKRRVTDIHVMSSFTCEFKHPYLGKRAAVTNYLLTSLSRIFSRLVGASPNLS